MKLQIPFCFYMVLGLLGCTHPENTLEDILKNQHGVIAKVMDDPSAYRLQVLYTQIDRDSANQPSFTSYGFRVNAQEYFYPASTVKLPVAVMAMEKLNAIGNPDLNIHTPMLTDSVVEWQRPVWSDSTSISGKPTVANYVRKIFLVSDNEAFNRLYEFLGQGPINRQLAACDLNNSKIVHRLSVPLTPEQNRHTNPVRFIHDDEVIYWQPKIYNEVPVPEGEAIPLGKGEMSGGQLVEKPKDFASKNSFTLEDQQRYLRELMFPGSTGMPSFQLDSTDYTFIYRAMGELPRESEYPPYPDREHYYDSYVKFFIYGDKKDPMPDHVRIFNKVGLAYGFLIDNAYIVDFEKNVEFFLSAILYVNDNGIFNDDTYEYDETGFPFLAELGKAIYQYECERPRAFFPDLSRFDVFSPSR